MKICSRGWLLKRWWNASKSAKSVHLFYRLSSSTLLHSPSLSVEESRQHLDYIELALTGKQSIPYFSSGTELLVVGQRWAAKAQIMSAIAHAKKRKHRIQPIIINLSHPVFKKSNASGSSAASCVKWPDLHSHAFMIYAMRQRGVCLTKIPRLFVFSVEVEGE